MPNDVLQKYRFPLGVKRHGVEDRGQSSVLAVLGQSVIPKHVGQRLSLHALLLRSHAVGKGVLGVCRGVSLSSLQPQTPQRANDRVGASGVDGAVGGADTLQTALRVDDEA